MELDTRTTALRSALVDTVEAETRRRSTPRSRVAVAAVAAFALAGAGTGGVVAAVAADSDSTAYLVGVAAMGLGTDHVAVGEPFTAAGSGATVFDLGVPPAEVQALSVTVACLDTGTVTARVEDTPAVEVSCEPAAEAAMGAMIDIEGRSALLLSVTSDSRFAVYATWVKDQARMSVAQQAGLADGTVTAEEYEQAFQRYAGCLAAAGYPLQEVDKSEPVYYFSVPGAAVDSGVDAGCYFAEFSEVSSLWQQENR